MGEVVRLLIRMTCLDHKGVALVDITDKWKNNHVSSNDRFPLKPTRKKTHIIKQLEDKSTYPQ